MHRGRVRGDDKIELHRPIAEATRFDQAMFSHEAPNSAAARARIDHEPRIRDMPAESGAIRPQDVAADDLIILGGDKRERARSKPIPERFLARSVWIVDERVARSDSRLKYFPDRVAIFDRRLPNLNATSRR